MDFTLAVLQFMFSIYFVIIMITTAAVVYFVYGGITMKKGTRQNAIIRKLYWWMFRQIHIIGFIDFAGKSVLRGDNARVLYYPDGSATMELMNGQNQPVPNQKYFWAAGKRLILFARWVNAQTLAPIDTSQVDEAGKEVQEKIQEKMKELVKDNKEIPFPMDVELPKVTFETDDPQIRSWVKTAVIRGITTGSYGFAGSKWKEFAPIIIISLLIVGGMLIIYTSSQGAAAAAEFSARAASESTKAIEGVGTVMEHYMNITQTTQQYQYNY